MSSQSPAPPQRPRPIGVATALMCALAGGAVWCLLSLYSRSEMAGFAFVVALPVVWTLRAHGFSGRWGGAVLAAACVLIAAVYAFCLQAVAQVASLLGLSMRTAFGRIDADTALAIARSNLSGWNAAIIVAAAALAVWLTLREGRARR